MNPSELAKGYEYEKGHYVCLSREELTQLLSVTAHQIDLREFVPPSDVDLLLFDSTFFVVPDRGGERAYALLFEALCRSGLIGVAQIAMHSRESVIVLRALGSGIVAQTLFYEGEIRRERQPRADRSRVAEQEVWLALQLMQAWTVHFEPLKYCDNYREGVQRLVQNRVRHSSKAPLRTGQPDGNLLRQLEQSLESAERKPSAASPVSPMPAPERKETKRAAS